MQDHIINDQIADLARAMLELDNMDEAYRFLEDIFTIHELQAVAQRLAVARLLQKKSDLSGNCRAHRRKHGDDQPRESLPDLWGGRLSADPWQNQVWGRNK